jgi:hypothetical protein
MKKKQLKPEQIEQKEHEKKINLELKKLTTRVKNMCKESSVSAVRLQLDFLIENKNVILPSDYLTRHQTIDCFNDGIDNYLESLL